MASSAEVHRAQTPGAEWGPNLDEILQLELETDQNIFSVSARSSGTTHLLLREITTIYTRPTVLSRPFLNSELFKGALHSYEAIFQNNRN